VVVVVVVRGMLGKEPRNIRDYGQVERQEDTLSSAWATHGPVSAELLLQPDSQPFTLRYLHPCRP
jgi:hypothetical protein